MINEVYMIEPSIKPTAASGLKRFLHVILNASKSFWWCHYMWNIKEKDLDAFKITCRNRLSPEAAVGFMPN
jgi:hypothetical protein